MTGPEARVLLSFGFHLSGYKASCPSCGAEVVFTLGSSLLKVCDFCGSAIARKGVDLADYGKVAELIPTPSVLKLGIEGGYEGAPRFKLIGRTQLDHGSGTWDEWLLAFDSEQWAWLSESQGKFHYMGQAPLPPVRDFGELKTGDTVNLGPAGHFVVTEKRTAKFVTAEGEIPFDAKPGSQLNYIDLQGKGGKFATLDYGTGDEAEALYVGSEVSLAELGIEAVSDAERRKKVEGGSLACTKCGGPLELRAPDHTKRIACSYCGALLDVENGFQVLETVGEMLVKPLIPLGSKGRLKGVEWQLIGFMERSVTYEGIRYAWQEYLLYEARGGFRWLTENKGHWSFIEPIHAGDVADRVGGYARYKGETFKHFQSGAARVDHVVGEFYWAVSRGDVAQTHDYVAAPLLLSMEGTEEEKLWSQGTYTEPEEIWKAFGLEGTPPRRHGVAPNQVWEHKEVARSIYGAAFLICGGIALLYVMLLLVGGKTVHTQEFPIRPGVKSGSTEAVVFSDEFEIDSGGNLEFQAKAPVSNSWLYIDGALINPESGSIDAFDLEVSYYFGRSSDGAWSEGSTSKRRFIGSVTPGKYILRLAPQWQTGKKFFEWPDQFAVRVRRNVPRFYQALLAILAVAAFPVWLGFRQLGFESRRWAESDHPSPAWSEG